MLAIIVTKIQERSPLKYNFTRKLASLDPRLIIVEPDTAVKMYKQVLTKLVDTKWRTTEQADGNDAFFYDVLHTQKTYEDLWTTAKFLITLSHDQAAVEGVFFSEGRSPCTKSQRR